MTIQEEATITEAMAEFRRQATPNEYYALSDVVFGIVRRLVVKEEPRKQRLCMDVHCHYMPEHLEHS